MSPGLEVTALPADAIEVGRITDAWGIKGWFKVHPYSAQPEALFSSRCWYLLPAVKGARIFSSPVKLSIRESKFHSGTVVAWASTIDDRAAAQALRGARIFVERAHFPPVNSDEYYWVDLIGLTVVNREEVDLGTVRELLSAGAQTVLVLDYPHEGKTLERMIPFVAAYIDNVNLPQRRIRVDWQPEY